MSAAGGLQPIGDCREPAAPRLLQRRQTRGVGDRRVGAGVEQDADDLLVRLRPVAVDDRLEQAVQPRSFTWFRSIPVLTTRRT